MRDRLKDWHDDLPGDAATSDLLPQSSERQMSADAENALIALGYKPQEATRMVKSLDVEGLSSEEIIRRALQAAIRK